MHRLILVVTGIAILVAFGGHHLVRNDASARERRQVVADTFADFARRSLQVGDKVLYVDSTVVLLTKDQSEMLSAYPKNLATVTGIGKDYFIVQADAARGTYSQAFGTGRKERFVRFEAVAEFQKYVNGKDEHESPPDP